MTKQLSPRVKQLVWEPCDTYKLTAWSPFGPYNIDECDGWWAFNHDVYGDFFEKMADHELPEEDAIDELKAAAQADFEQRIRSELEPAPVVSEAARVLLEYMADHPTLVFSRTTWREIESLSFTKPHIKAGDARALQQESGDE